MREIKFRAWDEKSKTMFYPHELFESKTGQRIGVVVNSPDSILMQYTGLKDKNGKEIYEGDVIDDETGQHCTVAFNAGAFWFMFAADTGYTYDWARQNKQWDKQTVIGNVYAHPELLK